MADLLDKWNVFACRLIFFCQITICSSKFSHLTSFFSTLFQYADPVADLLDKWDVFACRLFRESCVFHRGNYVKDLSRLGRELHKIIIVDNSPASYVFHPDNAVSILTHL